MLLRIGVFRHFNNSVACLPSVVTMTRECIPAPRGSIATVGEPSSAPSALIGWQITSRQPVALACFTVAVTLPSTRQSIMV